MKSNVLTWIISSMVAFSPLACSNGTDGGNGTTEIIDTCNGESQFVSIPETADILFSAGMYGENLDFPTEIYAMDLDENKICDIIYEKLLSAAEYAVKCKRNSIPM